MKIGILVHDNGEFDSYIGFFSDPERLKEVVKQLNDQYFYAWDHDSVTASVIEMDLMEVPAAITDAYLDSIASTIEDGAGVEIEMSAQRDARLADELEDAKFEGSHSIAVAEGQVTLYDMLRKKED